MKARILNRDFKHPTDGWYHIEPKGEHPNPAGNVIQVLDAEACEAIVNRFNQDAGAGNLSHGQEMLIDHEHFKHDSGKETIAYGWLTKLLNRADGIYGQVRWSATGQKAVDGGDYRFFSTEYDQADLTDCVRATGKIQNNESKARLVRPNRLDGLTLTNDPNNRGARPITNRTAKRAIPTTKCCPDCDCDLQPSADPDASGGTPHSHGQMTCPECQQTFENMAPEFPGGRNAVTNKHNQDKNRMKNIATKLGLAGEASEDAVLEAVTKLLNRVSTLEPLDAENKTLKNRVAELDASSVDALLAAHGVKDAKVLNRMKPILVATPIADRQACLEELIPKAAAAAVAPTQSAQTKLFNRDTKTPAAATGSETNASAENSKAQKIMNRAREIKKESPGVSDATSVIMAQREMESAS